MMAGLLPNNVKAELIGTKIELLDKLRFYKDNSRSNREAFNKFLEDFNEERIPTSENGIIFRKLKYKNIEFFLMMNRKELQICNKIDVYFITENNTEARVYSNKMGKYYVNKMDNGQYFVCCREYNWSKIKVE